jgi:hypothetical protein
MKNAAHGREAAHDQPRGLSAAALASKIDVQRDDRAALGLVTQQLVVQSAPMQFESHASLQAAKPALGAAAVVQAHEPAQLAVGDPLPQRAAPICDDRPRTQA